jgi:hypothetical protein
MSTVAEQDVPCPSCGSPTSVELFYSLHAVRRPDHRQAVLDDTLQRATCPACGAAFRVAPQLVYLDPSRGQWILASPVEHAARWTGFEEAAEELFDQDFGSAAPAPVAAIGRRLRPRVVFGWAALREKVLADALGVDDALLEAVKAVVLLGGDTVALDDTELRLVGADDDALELARLEPGSGRHVESLRVPRSLLADVGGADWTAIRELVAGGLYVDVGRMLAEEAA